MAELNHAKSFRDLVVYQKSKAVSHDVFELSKGFPKEETYSLTDKAHSFCRQSHVANRKDSADTDT